MDGEANKPSLEKLIGQTVIIRSVPIDEQHPAVVKLLAVEHGGIWIESQKVTEHWLSELKLTSTPKTLVWFLPFVQVAWVMSSVDYPSLSERLLQR